MLWIEVDVLISGLNLVRNECQQMNDEQPKVDRQFFSVAPFNANACNMPRVILGVIRLVGRVRMNTGFRLENINKRFQKCKACDLQA
jgi:hypothetical protein